MSADGISAPLLGWAVFKRELKQYLQSPGTYVALAFFFILSGASFISIIGEFVDASLKASTGVAAAKDAPPLNVTQTVVTQLFQLINFLMLFVIPMLTMRLVAEEKKSGTFELLVSTPLTNLDILLGKFFAALVIATGILGICAVYPVILGFYSHPEIPVVLSCYLGLFLVMIAYTAFGIFASALSESQIVAGVLSFVGLLVFQMIGWLFKAGLLGKAASALSMNLHSDNFTKGIVATPDVAYFLLFAFFFLFMAVQVLDARRWRVK